MRLYPHKQSVTARFTGDLSIFAAATGQFAGSQLLSSEEFGFGGEYFGRAFDFSEIAGDHGATGKVELRYARAADSVPFLRGMPLKDFQFFTYYDYGVAWRIDPVANGVVDGKHAQTGSSAGGGLRFSVNDNISGSIEIDKPLTRDVSARGTDGEEPRLFFQLSANFQLQKVATIDINGFCRKW